MTHPLAYMPLSTYPEAIADAAILGALRYGAGLGCAVHVMAFAADMPQVYTPIGDVAFDLQSLVAGAQKASAAEAKRLEALVLGAKGAVSYNYHGSLGAMMPTAAAEARLYDLVMMPWQQGALSVQEMAEAVVFGAGRPAVLVPMGAVAAPLQHLAIAWDDSRVAARALNDALPYLAAGGRISVLTAGADGQTSAENRAAALAAALKLRGYDAAGVGVSAGSTGISGALQDAALAQGAGLLAMGGFGHSRLRDFVLGGATKGILSDLKLPVMLSH